MSIPECKRLLLCLSYAFNDKKSYVRGTKYLSELHKLHKPFSSLLSSVAQREDSYSQQQNGSRDTK